MRNDKEKSHCSVKLMPVPEISVCKRCGAETEIWSDEEDTVCGVCGRRVLAKETVAHQCGLSSAKIS